MFRLAAAGVGVVLLCAAAYFMPWPPLSPFFPGSTSCRCCRQSRSSFRSSRPPPRFRAVRHAAQAEDDILLLARSIDVALKDVAARTEKETATIGEMTTSVSARDRTGCRRGSPRATSRCRTPAANADNVVPHPSARRPRAAPPAAEHRQRPSASAVEAAYPQGGRGRRVRHLAAADRFGLAQRGQRLRGVRQPAARRRHSASICGGWRIRCRASKSAASSASC